MGNSNGSKLSRRDKMLFKAAERGDVSGVQSALRAGANIEAAKDHRWTALHVAIYHRRGPVIDVLLESGAQANAICNAGTPLHMAKSVDHITALVNAGANVNLAAQQGETPIFVVSGRRLVQALLEAGADVNVVSSTGRTPIHVAAIKNHVTFDVLVEAGVDINAQDHDGRTALHCAALERNEHMIGPLLDAGANINATDHRGMTPLHVPCLRPRSQDSKFARRNLTAIVVGLLLGAGADRNATDSDGQTPLHLAVSAGRVSCVHILLRSGAVADAVNAEGKTPVDLADSDKMREAFAMSDDGDDDGDDDGTAGVGGRGVRSVRNVADFLACPSHISVPCSHLSSPCDVCDRQGQDK